MSMIERLTEEIMSANDYERLSMLLFIARTHPEAARDALVDSAAELAVELSGDQLDAG